MTPARILLVDDSAFMRQATTRMLEPLPQVRVVGTARDGGEAVEKVRALRPDLVIMDVEMPRMDGLRALERIMAECPTPVLLLSSHTRPGAEITLQALEAGAVDFVDKSGAGSAMDIHALAGVLQKKVLELTGAGAAPKARTAAPVEDPAASDAVGTAAAPEPSPPATGGPYEVVAIGASTGGPRALAALLPALGSGFRVPVIVAQHMPAGFTATLAERLHRQGVLPVAEARHGDRLVPGRVLVAPGGMQVAVERCGDSLCLRVWPEPGIPHRPSVDVLLDSVARVAGGRGVGVVLTGMGSDGAAGLARLRAAGGRTVVESAESAVIDGMPGAARASAERSLPLARIGPYLAQLCEAR